MAPLDPRLLCRGRHGMGRLGGGAAHARAVPLPAARFWWRGIPATAVRPLLPQRVSAVLFAHGFMMAPSNCMHVSAMMP